MDASELHVGKQLSFVDRNQLVDAFQFNDDRVVDQQVDPVSALDSGVSEILCESRLH